MKQCPTCRTTYTDETLRFCLADGGILFDLGKEAETVTRHGVRIDVQPPSYPTIPVAGEQRPAKGNLVLKIVAAVLILGFLGLLGLGAAGALFYFNSGGTSVAVASPSPTPTPVPTRSPSPSPTPDSDEERLEQELANLQKQLEDALKPSPTKTPPGFSSDDLPTARVNSPADGFLALRSEPDAETGERLAQIPHGTVITLENCEKEKVKIGSRTGRWCMVTYRGQTGWVFDAWLEY
jgi:Bacterial SH3 domain